MLVLLTALTGYRIVEVADRGGRIDTQVTYITRRALRVEFPSNGIALVMRVEKGGIKADLLNLKDSTYTDLSAMAATFGAAYLAMFVKCESNGENCEVDTSVVKATDEYKRINGRRARKVIYYMRNLGGFFASTGQPMPDSIASWFVKDWRTLYRAEVMRTEFLSEFTIKAINDPQARALVRKVTPFLKRVLKRYGAPIVTVTPTMGKITKVTRISAKKVSVSEDRFKVPEGFRRK